MKNVGGSSRYIAFLDECGNHEMERIDSDFPLFLLSCIVVERHGYLKEILPAINQLKLSYWNHEGINLHSRDIRKAKGPFSFLQNADKREAFMQELSSLMTSLPYTVFISAIHKDAHLKRYGELAKNPYELALEFTMERVRHFLELKGIHDLPFVAEARGKKEDHSLERVFYRVLAEGTQQMPADRFRSLNCSLVFRTKYDNIAGTQLADLCAHPCARHILNPGMGTAPIQSSNRKFIVKMEFPAGKYFLPKRKQAPPFPESACRPRIPSPPKTSLAKLLLSRIRFICSPTTSPSPSPTSSTARPWSGSVHRLWRASIAAKNHIRHFDQIL